jgi:hypothetical protein
MDIKLAPRWLGVGVAGEKKVKVKHTTPCCEARVCLVTAPATNGGLSQLREHRGKLQLGSTLRTLLARAREPVNGNYGHGSVVATFRKLGVEFLVDRFAGFLGRPERERDGGS